MKKTRWPPPFHPGMPCRVVLERVAWGCSDVVSGRVACCWVMDATKGRDSYLREMRTSKYILCKTVLSWKPQSSTFYCSQPLNDWHNKGQRVDIES